MIMDFMSHFTYTSFLPLEPIINLLKSSQNRFDFSFQAPPQLDQVLDLSKRRDSTETRKSLSPTSLEGRSPSTRDSSPSKVSVNILHRHNHITKQIFTPEHAVRYQYNFDHSPPSSTSPMNKEDSLRSPLQRFNQFDRSPIQTKQETPSTSPQPAPISASEYFLSQQNKSIQELDHHDLSNDSPSRRSLNSSCSSSSSQKSPSSSSNPSMLVMGRDGKLARPFKAYPRDPLNLNGTGTIMDVHSSEKYNAFRKRMLDQIHAANGGQPVINNPKMRRISNKNNILEANNNNNDFLDSSYDSEKMMIHNSITGKDEAYFERRKKNNAAAKKSRDRRRIKEDEIAIRAAYLERENIELKFELATSRKQLALYGINPLTGVPN
ncbi:unnamed protein product [Diamesa tonsa]